MLNLFKVKRFLLIPLLCLLVMIAGACGTNTGRDAQKNDSSLTVLDEQNQWAADDAVSDGTREYNDTGGDKDQEYDDEDQKDPQGYVDADENDLQKYEDEDRKDPQGNVEADENDLQKYDDEDQTDDPEEKTEKPDQGNLPDEEGTYTTKQDVALFLHVYGRLPDNFMTKKEARALGWSGGSLEKYAPGMCIGGDRFGNYEGNLPDGNYHECDINTLGKSKRGAERLIYSDDGRIYYTDDHYETFTLLYGKE